MKVSNRRKWRYRICGRHVRRQFQRADGTSAYPACHCEERSNLL